MAWSVLGGQPLAPAYLLKLAEEEFKKILPAHETCLKAKSGD